MQRKRIAIPFTGEHVGGSHFSTLLLLDGLDRSLVEPILLLHGEGPLADFLRKRSVPFIIEPLAVIQNWEGSPLRRLLASFLAIFPIIRLIKKHRLNLIHTQDHKCFQLWILGAFLARCPVLVHWRGPYRKTLITRLMMMLATRILVISNYLRDKLPDESRRRATLIYNPFDTEQPIPDREGARSALRSELDLPEDAVLLGWIGNFNRRKQPGQFVDIVTKLASKRPSSSISGVMMGRKGDLENDPGWTAKLTEAGSLVRDLGFRDPVVPSLAACDALVVTAANEPFGRTVVEAMLSGVPVVAARDGGYVEVLAHGKTGFLVPPGDQDAFVTTIEQVLGSADIETIREQARQTAMERFSIDRHARSVMTVYQSLLGEAAPHSRTVGAETAN